MFVELLRAMVIVAGAVVVGRAVRHGWWPRQGERWAKSRPLRTRLFWTSFALLSAQAVVMHAVRLGQEQIAPYFWINALAFGLALSARRFHPVQPR